MIQLRLKRIFDLFFSVFLLVCSSPFMLLAIMFVKICSPESPVFFKQKRVGRYRKIFTIYKLRTMTNEKNPVSHELLPDEYRLKKWGKIIRKTNIDEIPQLINIIKGEMSLIGPRPIMEKEMIIMNEEEQALRQSVRPGISGWEAVNESKTKNRREMAEMDLEYVIHWSMWFDIKIFLLTIYIIFANKRPMDEIRAPRIENEVGGRQ